MRRSARQLLVGILAGTTAVTGVILAPLQAGAAPAGRHPAATTASAPTAVPAPGATAGAVVTARSRPAPARTLTLVTGDRVTVRTVAGRTTYAVSPARRSGPGAALRTLHLGSHDYVMPVVAQAFLGSTLDPALFEVSATAGAAAAPAATVPVRITHSGGRPTLPGVTVTADAGGIASGYLTKASARVFGDALVRQWTADRRAGRAQASGLFAGIRRISTVDAAPARVSPRFAMLTLVIKGIDAYGKPMDGGAGLFMNVDDGRKYVGFVDIEGGEARVSLPAGHYSGEVDWAGMSATTSTLVVRSVPVPQLTVTSSGQRLTIDARQATAAPRVTTPRPVGSDSEETFAYNRVDATGRSSISVGNTMGTDTDYRVRPTPAVTVGTQGFATAYHLQAPGASPAYTYDLAYSSKAVAADQTHRVSAAQVSTISARYDTDQPGRDVAFARYAIDPTTGWSVFSMSPLRTPLRRTEYVVGAGGQLWGELEIGNDLADDPAGIDAVRGYPAGTQRSVSWRRGALGAGIPALDATVPAGFCYACRTGNTLGLALAPFTDAEPDHVGELAPSPDGSPVTHLTLSSGRTVLVDRDDALGAAVTVPAGTASYKAVLDVDRSWAGTTTSTRSHTELAFSSSAGAGPVAPKGLPCSDDPHATCRVLPVLQAKVVLPTSSTGTLPAGTSTVDVVAARVQGAAAAPVSSAALELRPAGFGWAAFPVKAVGGGRFRAAVDLPDFLAGRPFDVRFSAKDAGGSTFTQTVVRAFSLRATSAGTSAGSAGPRRGARARPRPGPRLPGPRRAPCRCRRPLLPQPARGPGRCTVPADPPHAARCRAWPGGARGRVRASWPGWAPRPGRRSARRTSGSGRPTSPRPTGWTRAAAPGRRSPSSTPMTTPGSRRTWPSTARRGACPRAPAPPGASARSTSAGPPGRRRLMPGGGSRSPSTSRPSRPRARAAGSCWWRPTPRACRTSGPR